MILLHIGYGQLMVGWLNWALWILPGYVVHINAGIAAIVTRLFWAREKILSWCGIPPHNIPFVVLGAALLWIGWIGLMQEVSCSRWIAGSAF